MAAGFALVGLCGLALALAMRTDGWAQEGYVNRELEIQAAYLFNFGKYVTWPEGADPSQPFVIGVVGDSPIQGPLSRLAKSKSLNNRPIAVKPIKAASDYQACQILFVPDGQNHELVAEVVRRARATPTLIVGERRTSLEGGGMVNFFPEGNTLRFEIDPKAADRAQLKISSKLLALGKTVGP